MQITTNEWNDIVKYIQNKLLQQTEVSRTATGIAKAVIPELTLIGTMSTLTLSDYIIASGAKKEKKKPVQIDNEYDQSWRLFWNTWPSTKSVPGTQYRSGAKMKGNEQGMYKKWLAAVVSDISIERMQYAAECYLQWAYTESINKGRNELEHRNGLEPWLNQSLYLNYADVPMPPVAKQQIQYQNSTDQ